MKKLLGSSDVEDLVAWRGRIDPANGRTYFAPALAVNKCQDSGQCDSSLGTYPYETYMTDPTGDSNEPVLKIGYPKVCVFVGFLRFPTIPQHAPLTCTLTHIQSLLQQGSWSPASEFPGGILFFAYPYKSVPTAADGPISVQSATLEYEVYFPDDFDFVKGGKLLGMSGGEKMGRGCGGGVDPDHCFSFRVMWRRNGDGEAYIYAKEGEQGDDFCTMYPKCDNKQYPQNGACTICDYAHGVSFARGSFRFQTGKWQQLRLHITLNDPSEANGYLGLEYNGKLVMSYDKMKWRVADDMHIEGVEMASWFGGSDDTWSPPKDTYTLVRNIKLYRTGPPTSASTGSNGRAAIVTPGPTHQTVVEEVMDIAPW